MEEAIPIIQQYYHTNNIADLLNLNCFAINHFDLTINFTLLYLQCYLGDFLVEITGV